MGIVVGYIGDIRTKEIAVEELVSQSVESKLNLLVVCGGISNDYLTTLELINDLGDKLGKQGIALRFVIGNTDLYYTDEVVVNKEKKVRKILALYGANPYFLPTNPIVRSDFRLVGYTSWYDYSLYRGTPLKLSAITKKRKLWYKNLDNRYITDENDYALGVKNTFDNRFTRENARKLEEILHTHIRKHGISSYNIVVGYHKTVPYFLDNGVLKDYSETFAGAKVFHNIMVNNGVKEYYFGCKSQEPYAKVDGVDCYCCSVSTIDGIEVVEYNDFREI